MSSPRAVIKVKKKGKNSYFTKYKSEYQCHDYKNCRRCQLTYSRNHTDKNKDIHGLQYSADRNLPRD
jgi:hypothetical protein